MAFRREDYPADWEAIRARLLVRAGNRCEGTPQFPTCRARNGEPHPVTGSTVVLTCAHMWDKRPMACEEHNLRMLCQRCHLKWDRLENWRDAYVWGQGETAEGRMRWPGGE